MMFFVVCLDNVQRECYPGEWPCPSSGVCIPLDHLCDGTAHCLDGEDETNTTAGRNCSQLPPKNTKSDFCQCCFSIIHILL